MLSWSSAPKTEGWHISATLWHESAILLTGPAPIWKPDQKEIKPMLVIAGGILLAIAFLIIGAFLASFRFTTFLWAFTLLMVLAVAGDRFYGHQDSWTVPLVLAAISLTWQLIDSKFRKRAQARMAAQFKRCPECAETVLAQAKVCKYCGSKFSPLKAVA
jgi:hypothetical protein